MSKGKMENTKHALPKSVEIMGVKVRITTDKKKWIKWGGKKQDTKMSGAANFMRRIIYIWDGADYRLRRTILLHEIIHCLWAAQHNDPGGVSESSNLEEFCAEWMDTTLIEVMDRNPKVRDYIFGTVGLEERNENGE